MASRMIGAEEIMAMLGVSRGYAYQLIKQLNDERRAKGCVTLTGKVSRDYFEQRLFPDSPRPREEERLVS